MADKETKRDANNETDADTMSVGQGDTQRSALLQSPNDYKLPDATVHRDSHSPLTKAD